MSSKAANSLGALTLALMITALFMVFAYVPTEADQGIVQRIFYFHVPCAWVAFAAFALVALSGTFYLWLGQAVSRVRFGQSPSGEPGGHGIRA
jgi:heme exporter protein C